MKHLTHLAAGLVFATNVTAAPIGIDDFSGDSFTFTAPADYAASPINAGQSSAGFTRQSAASSNNGDTTIRFNSGATAGLYSHSQDAGVSSSSSEVIYDLGGLDINQGANAFRLQLTTIDLNGDLGMRVDGIDVILATTDILLENFTDNGNSFVFPFYVDFLFSDFASVNFDNVNSVSFFIGGNDSMDAGIDSFATVCSANTTSGYSGIEETAGSCMTTPVPGSVWLLASGLLGLTGFSRRKLKKV